MTFDVAVAEGPVFLGEVETAHLTCETFARSGSSQLLSFDDSLVAFTNEVASETQTALQCGFLSLDRHHGELAGVALGCIAQFLGNFTEQRPSRRITIPNFSIERPAPLHSAARVGRIQRCEVRKLEGNPIGVAKAGVGRS